MKTSRHELQRFAFYDHTAIQAHLEDLAAQGWFLEKAGSYVWRYRRGQPQKLRIAVTYFPSASGFDPGPTEGQRQMEEYCAKDGWVLAARWGQMQIFSNGAEGPVPIETDALTQVETIHRAMRRSMLPAHLVLLALCVCQLVLTAWQFLSAPAAFLSTPSSLFMAPVWLLLLLPALLEIVFYLRWYHTAKAAAENGAFLAVRPRRAPGLILLAASAFLLLSAFSTSAAGPWAALLWIGLVLLILFSTGRATGWMKKKGASRRVNRTLSMAVSVVLTLAVLAGLTTAIIRCGLPNRRIPVETYAHYGRMVDVYHDDLPLQIEDLMETDLTDWSLERRGTETVLLANTEYRQWPLTEEPDAPSLEYTVTEIKAPFLYGLCEKGYLQEKQSEVVDGAVVLRDEYLPSDAALWGAKAAYQHYWSGGFLNRYLLCYENRIVEIHFSWEPTREQMAIAAQKLSGE